MMCKGSGGVVAVVLVALCSSSLISVTGEIVVASDLTRDSARNFSLPEQISQMMDFFNANRLAENWLTISDILSANCSRNMEQYLQGLADHAIWAMKSKWTISPLITFYSNL